VVIYSSCSRGTWRQFGLGENSIYEGEQEVSRNVSADLELRQVGKPAAHGADLSEGEWQKSFEASEPMVDLIEETYLAGSRTPTKF